MKFRKKKWALEEHMKEGLIAKRFRLNSKGEQSRVPKADPEHIRKVKIKNRR